jgi:hypothetical protein
MSMVEIGDVRMCVLQGVVTVSVGVWLCDAVLRQVFVLMMLVVNVAVIVHFDRMEMGVRVARRQHREHACSHDDRCDRVGGPQALAEQRDRRHGAEEGRGGEISGLARSTEEAQRTRVEQDAEPEAPAPSDKAGTTTRAAGTGSPASAATRSIKVPAPSDFQRTKATGSRRDKRCVRLLSIAQARHAAPMASVPVNDSLESIGVHASATAPPTTRSAPASSRHARCSRNTRTAMKIVSGASRLRRSVPATPESLSSPSSMRTGPTTPPISAISTISGTSPR